MTLYEEKSSYKTVRAMPGSSGGCMSDWYSGGGRFDPPVRQHSFVEIGHLITSTAILFLPLIQVSNYQLLSKGCALSTGTGHAS